MSAVSGKQEEKRHIKRRFERKSRVVFLHFLYYIPISLQKYNALVANHSLPSQ